MAFDLHGRRGSRGQVDECEVRHWLQAAEDSDDGDESEQTAGDRVGGTERESQAYDAGFAAGRRAAFLQRGKEVEEGGQKEGIGGPRRIAGPAASPSIAHGSLAKHLIESPLRFSLGHLDLHSPKASQQLDPQAQAFLLSRHHAPEGEAESPGVHNQRDSETPMTFAASLAGNVEEFIASSGYSRCIVTRLLCNHRD
eukprot:3528764-Rhodomonas_salina.2